MAVASEGYGFWLADGTGGGVCGGSLPDFSGNTMHSNRVGGLLVGAPRCAEVDWPTANITTATIYRHGIFTTISPFPYVSLLLSPTLLKICKVVIFSPSDCNSRAKDLQ